MIKEITDRHIYIQTTTKIGQQLDAVYIKSKDAWRLPLNLGALRDLYLQGYDVEQLGKKLADDYKHLIAKKHEAPQLHEWLRPYQVQDLNFLLAVPYAGVFNEQRTGKTPTVCEVLNVLNVPTIIVVPASLVLNWRDELQKWTSLDVLTVMGTKQKRVKTYQQFHTSGGVLIISKDTLRVDVDFVTQLPYDCVIVDEAHYLRNYQTKQSQAVYRLGKKAKRRYALTGTPAAKSPADIFGILHFLDPVQWSSYWQFVERYFLLKQNFFGGKDIGDFKSDSRKREYVEILNVISTQRKRKDVMKWLPKKQYQTIKLQMDKKQQKAYDEMLNTFEIEEIELDAINVLTQMLRLRQITTVPKSIGLDTHGVKFEFIKEYLANNPGDPIVVFSNFSSGLHLMEEALREDYRTGIITGNVSKVDRSRTVNLFQRGEIDVLFCNIDAAGTGLTLDRAGTVIFLDRHYTPANNEQAEDRIVATTEQSNLSALVIDLVCESTLDEKILDIVKQKKDVTKVVNEYKDIREWLK